MELPGPRSSVLPRLLRPLVRGATAVAFSEVEVRGLGRVAWDQPCILSPNHPNAFLDAMLVGAHAPVEMTYLARADVFGTPFDGLLGALGMVPVYRRRDGYEHLSRTREILAAQRERLRDGGTVLMFSEAEHAHTYPLRPLTKGSARLALETQRGTDRAVQLVPIGLNYYHLRQPGFKVSMVVGDPIRVRAHLDRYRAAEAEGIRRLRDELAARMKTCLLVPEATADHRTRIGRINRKNEPLSFPEMKEALRTPEALAPKGEHRTTLGRGARSLDLLHAGPLWVYRRLYRWADDPVFALSLKIAVGMWVLPLWWGGLFAVGAWAAGPGVGAGVALVAALGTALRTVLVRHSNPPHPPDALEGRDAGHTGEA